MSLIESEEGLKNPRKTTQPNQKQPQRNPRKRFCLSFCSMFSHFVCFVTLRLTFAENSVMKQHKWDPLIFWRDTAIETLAKILSEANRSSNRLCARLLLRCWSPNFEYFLPYFLPTSKFALNILWQLKLQRTDGQKWSNAALLTLLLLLHYNLRLTAASGINF